MASDPPRGPGTFISPAAAARRSGDDSLTIGAQITWREVPNGRPWVSWPVRVVADQAELLAVWWADGTPLTFHEHPLGRHPWSARPVFSCEHGVLVLHTPGDRNAVWLFWDGPGRAVRHWYVNLQRPFVRTQGGLDTRDDELDIVVAVTGEFELKDRELVRARADEGRWSARDAEAILAEGDRLARLLADGLWWWDRGWADWQPDASWSPPAHAARPALPRGARRSTASRSC